MSSTRCRSRVIPGSCWSSPPPEPEVSARDKEVIRQLHAPDWKAWFATGGDPRAGTPDDPRLVLIGVDVVSATYFEVDKPQPVVLYELVKAWVKGDPPDVGEVHRVGRG